MNQQEPEEMQYPNNQNSISEMLFSSNFNSHNKAEIDYSFLCLETVDLWLRLNYNQLDDHSSRKGIAYTFCLRGRRLLRSSQLLLLNGYLPESEILYRSLWETLMTLAYLIEDYSEERIKKYISFGHKSGWDLKTLTGNLLGEAAYLMYRELSLYVHPSNLGIGKMVYNNKFQVDAIHDYGSAGQLLVMNGDMAMAICEISNITFGLHQEWVDKQIEIYQTEIHQKSRSKIVELQNQEGSTVQAVLDWLRKHG